MNSKDNQLWRHNCLQTRGA